MSNSDARNVELAGEAALDSTPELLAAFDSEADFPALAAPLRPSSADAITAEFASESAGELLARAQLQGRLRTRSRTLVMASAATAIVGIVSAALLRFQMGATEGHALRIVESTAAAVAAEVPVASAPIPTERRLLDASSPPATTSGGATTVLPEANRMNHSNDARVARQTSRPRRLPLQAAPIAPVQGLIPLVGDAQGWRDGRFEGTVAADDTDALVETRHSESSASAGATFESVDVTVTAEASDPDGDTLTYRWSAPTGRFANARDRQTIFTCAEPSVPVVVTVDVIDSKGASARDTMVVPCARPTR